MTARWSNRFHVELEKQMAARGAARVKTAEVLGAKLSAEKKGISPIIDTIA